MIEPTVLKLMRSRLPSALAASLLAAGLLTQSAVAQSAKPTLLQRIRQLIGLNRPIAAGGSRSASALSVCLITPHSVLDAKGQALALLPLPRPTVLAFGPLNEVRIDRGGQLAWRQRASSTQAIEGPIIWPIDPIQPGEKLSLLIRPRGASGGDFARIKLVGASAVEMEANKTLVEQLGADPKAWLAAIDRALERKDIPLAWGLLYSDFAPNAPSLRELKKEILRYGCGTKEAISRP